MVSCGQTLPSQYGLTTQCIDLRRGEPNLNLNKLYATELSSACSITHVAYLMLPGRMGQFPFSSTQPAIDYIRHRLNSVASVQENLPRVALFEGMWYAGGKRSGAWVREEGGIGNMVWDQANNQ